MTYTDGQRVEARLPSTSDPPDSKFRVSAWDWWAGAVTAGGHLSGREVYHVRLDAGQTVTVRREHLRAAKTRERDRGDDHNNDDDDRT